MAARTRLRCRDPAAAWPSRPRPPGHRRDVREFRCAGAAAADGRDRDFVCLAVDHGHAGGADSEGASAALPMVGGGGRSHRRHRDGVALSRYPGNVHARHRGAHDRRDLRACRRVSQCRNGHPDAAADRERNHVVDRLLLLADLCACRTCDAAVRLAAITPCGFRRCCR